MANTTIKAVNHSVLIPAVRSPAATLKPYSRICASSGTTGSSSKAVRLFKPFSKALSSRTRMGSVRAASEVVTAVSAAVATTSSAGSLSLLSFTPVTAALGGLLLGIATAGKLLSTGRILGISGTVKGLVTGDLNRWRIAFMLGLSIGAFFLSSALPAVFESIPASFPIWRTALAGLLVGVGSSLGNGCTSGHGICGSARLSPRSLAYTVTFMAAGMATATLTGTAAALNVAPLPASLALPTYNEIQFAAVVASAGIAAYMAISVAALVLQTRGSPVASAIMGTGASAVASLIPGAKQAETQLTIAGLELGSEVLSGLLFALGLGLSGMLRPSKVAGFLSVNAPSWDPSLPFVMGGAVVVALLAFQAVMRFKVMSKPVLCPSFQIPTTSVIDARLLAGGILFGSGWGLAGLCPGPALVSSLYGDVHVLYFLGAMTVGMWLEALMTTLGTQRKMGTSQTH